MLDLDSNGKSLASFNKGQIEPNLLNLRDDKLQALNRKESTAINTKQQHEKTFAKQELSNNIEDLNEVLKNLEDEQNEKKNILNGMDKLLKTMLKTTKSSVGTQVEDGELFWKPQHYVGDNMSQGSNIKSQANVNNQNSSRGFKQDHQKNTYGNQQQQSKGHLISSVNELKASEEGNQMLKIQSNLTYKSPMEDYGNTQKMLLMKEEDRLADLEAKLNQLVNQAKNPDQNNQDKNNDANTNQVQWNIPSHILVFIANSIEENQSGRVLPWPEFKQIIYEIYDHRLINASEVNGVVNHTYLSIDEYILLYFLDKQKLRRLAEVKLIEMLTSLKYYVDIWPRAKNFAQLLNIVRPSKIQTQQSQKISNPSQNLALQELSMPNIDIYYQEFFLYAYAVLQQDKDHFLESKDGVTYVKVTYEEHATTVLLSWFNDQDTRKWFHKVRRNVKKIKTSALDDFETDYIDIDVLLNMYCEEYKSKRKSNQKNLSKEFMRKYQEQEGLFNTEEIDKIVQICVPNMSPSAFVKFPGIISVRRAFLYALVCGENSFDINTQEFIAGCNRFGIDNPCPTITKRIALYGNDEDFEDVVKKELIKSNIQQQSKIHTIKPNKTGIKIEAARISTQSFYKNDAQPLSHQNSGQKQIQGITNLKLMGRMQHSALDTNSNTNISDPNTVISGGVKLNIAQLTKDLTGDILVGSNKKGCFTNEETSIGNKKIIIPSFSTTSALFSQHFSILRDLKKRIEGLKQAYYNQREEERSWEQVEKILHVLEAACKFLDFPIQQ